MFGIWFLLIILHGFTPVQQSLQEYLGVLLDDPVRWISRNTLKGNLELDVLR